ncbi:hypothetical protein A4A49_05894 [Nicotiana attenuata]|uniref:Uncharacterized protein n=1 Tax=Nicotiana attenuata TaxID=49451 RepID=A0A314L7J5_NICAT|nr:hypothetical protein A4A49_05894 [Nicotiana attenuata]
MGNSQTTTKEEAESQGACERIFKALNVRPAFRYFRPQTQSPKSATKSRVATSTDHHRDDPAKATGFKLVAQNGSTIPLDLKGQQNMIPLHENDQNLSFASNMVLVEYNHSSVDSTNNKYPVKNMAANVVHHIINDGPKSVQSQEYDADTDRFSKYIDHVKNKMKTMSSFDDDDDDTGVGRAATKSDSFNDKVSHYIYQPLQVQDQGAA